LKKDLKMSVKKGSTQPEEQTGPTCLLILSCKKSEINFGIRIVWNSTRSTSIRLKKVRSKVTNNHSSKITKIWNWIRDNIAEKTDRIKKK